MGKWDLMVIRVCLAVELLIAMVYLSSCLGRAYLVISLLLRDI